MSESTFQTQVLRYLNSLPGCIAENVSGNANQSGRADINACYHGDCVKIELKDHDTAYKATKLQKLYLLKWKKAGAITAVCRTLEEIKDLITAIEVYHMKFRSGMNTKQKIEALQRYILVHSIIYYHLDDNVISDKKYDKVARLLAKKQAEHNENKILKTQYGYVFYDFDGSTGFDLLDRLNKSDRKYLMKIAKCVLRLKKGDF